MRKLLSTIVLFSAAFGVGAADRPTNLQPAPDLPPPPLAESLDPALEPQITIRTRGTDTIEEYRVGGKLYMIKVTPAHGVSYYLMDEKGDGRMTRQDSMDSGLRPPMWVIHSW